jgi:type IV pilus assembly protein PilE
MNAMIDPARQRGVTLVELMIVVVIITVLAAIGYPSYTDFITRSNRQAGKNLIYAIADRQEQFFLDNKQYAPDLTTLGFAADTIACDRDGQQTAATDADRTYVLDLTNTSATTYTVRAAPQLKQAARDAACGTLTVTHLGQRDASGGGANCW